MMVAQVELRGCILILSVGFGFFVWGSKRVIPTDSHFLVEIDDVPAHEVREEQGWRGIDIRFPLPTELAKAAGIALFRVIAGPSARHKVHTHPNADEIFYVIRGNAVIGVGEESHEIKAGSVDFVPKGTPHWMRVDPDSEIESVGGYLKVGSLDEAGYDFIGEIE